MVKDRLVEKLFNKQNSQADQSTSTILGYITKQLQPMLLMNHYYCGDLRTNSLPGDNRQHTEARFIIIIFRVAFIRVWWAFWSRHMLLCVC